LGGFLSLTGKRKECGASPTISRRKVCGGTKEEKMQNNTIQSNKLWGRMIRSRYEEEEEETNE
jgi:hypothetical protein